VFALPCIGDDDASVAGHAFSVGPEEGRLAVLGAEGWLVQAEEIYGLEGFFRDKGRLDGGGRLSVPWTDALTIVAAEQMAAEGSAQVQWDGASELDGEVADASASVEPAGLCEGVGGANREAASAGSATLGLKRGGRFCREVEGQADLCEKEVGA